MKDTFKQLIDNFLTASTYNRALLIDGAWGSGKTHFLKHELKDYLTTKQYTLVYVTVNGLSSVASLKKGIMLDLFKSSDKQDSFITKAIDRFKRLVNYTERADALFMTFDIDDFVKIDQTVFCFDDVERLTMPLEEFLGFINTEFIEHKGIRVILVGDTNKNELAKQSFKSVQEKYVGWSTAYEPDSVVVIKAIIELFNQDLAYHTFLLKHSEFIQDLCLHFHLDNFRTVQFYLESLKIVYHHVTLYEHFERIEKHVMYFTFIMALEYKSGNLSQFESHEELPEYITGIEKKRPMYYDVATNTISNSSGISSSLEKQIEEYKGYFTRYLSMNKFVMHDEYEVKYFFVKPIYELTTTGRFDGKELLEILTVMANKFQPYQKREDNLLIRQLRNYVNLPESDFDSLYSQLRRKIEDGEFELHEFIHAIGEIFWFAQIKLVSETHDEVAKWANTYFDKIKPYDRDIRTIYGPIRIENIAENLKSKDAGLFDNIVARYEEELRTSHINSAAAMLSQGRDSLFEADKLNTILEYLPAEDIIVTINANLKDRTYLEQVSHALHYNKSAIYFNNHTEKLKKIGKGIADRLNTSQDLDKIDRYYVRVLIATLDSFSTQPSSRSEE